MGLKQDLETVRDTVGAVLHNVNTALAERGVPTVGTLAALPDALDALDAQAAADAFWDTYQEGGDRTNYAYAFSGAWWTAEKCKPKYAMRPTNASYIFAHTGVYGDLDEVLDVTLDFSQCKNMSYAFYKTGNAGGRMTLGTIDMSSATSFENVFANVDVIGIKSFVPPSREMPNYSFQSGLVDLTVDGHFTKTVNLSRCSKLTKASIISVLSALSDTATGQTVTFSRTAVNKAFETAEGMNDGTSSLEWEAMCWEHTNWTIALA